MCVCACCNTVAQLAYVCCACVVRAYMHERTYPAWAHTHIHPLEPPVLLACERGLMHRAVHRFVLAPQVELGVSIVAMRLAPCRDDVPRERIEPRELVGFGVHASEVLFRLGRHLTDACTLPLCACWSCGCICVRTQGWSTQHAAVHTPYNDGCAHGTALLTSSQNGCLIASSSATEWKCFDTRSRSALLELFAASSDAFLIDTAASL
jgi:hypothetical protein